jgi:8-oxo-dGTP diphosphatase
MKRVVAGLIVKDGKLLVCQRTRHQTMPLKWEFPGGKIEEGEQPRDALRRELEEELGILATIGDMQWAEPKDLAKYDFLEADLTLVTELAAGKLL